MDFPLISPQGRGYSLPLNVARTVNFYPVIDPAGKRPSALYGCPGCEQWDTIGDGPIRGMLAFGGVGYVVSGDEFYSVTSAGVETLRGTLLTNSGPVSLETNGLQILVCDGDTSIAYLDNYGILKPSTGGTFYVYDISAASFAEAPAPGVPSGQSFYITSLADFTTVDALDFASAESSPDDLVRILADHGELWLFGSGSSEVWRDNGDGTFPFVRIQSLERGIAAAYSAAKADNTVCWLGDDLIVYRADGYSPVRMSTEQVEFSIGRMDVTSDAIAFTYDQEGHKFYVLTFPTEGVTWCYDFASRLWHERSSSGLAWRARAYMKLGAKHLIGDAETNKVLEVRTDIYDDNGDDLIATHTSPVFWADMNPLSHDRLELDFESGVGLVSGDDPQCILDWTDDNGASFSNRLQRSIGPIGSRGTKAVFNRLGTSERRAYRITISDPVKRVILGASLNANQGMK